jgi:hypothetical protein
MKAAPRRRCNLNGWQRLEQCQLPQYLPMGLAELQRLPFPVPQDHESRKLNP